MNTQRSNTQLATWPRVCVCVCVCPGCIQSSTRSEYRLVGTAGVHNPAPTVVAQLPRHAKAVGTTHPYIYHIVSMRAYVRQHTPTHTPTDHGHNCVWHHMVGPLPTACHSCVQLTHRTKGGAWAPIANLNVNDCPACNAASTRHNVQHINDPRRQPRAHRCWRGAPTGPPKYAASCVGAVSLGCRTPE